MKVYSSSKIHRRLSVPPTLNVSTRTNIERLSSLLNPQPSSLSLSPSQLSVTGEEEALSLTKEFVSNLADPCQCMLLYPLLLDSRLDYAADPLLKSTAFPVQLHSLLTLHLHKATSFLQLQARSRKLIDIFYGVVGGQAPELLEEWLSREDGRSLGEWFYLQCIANFFQHIFAGKQPYSLFFTRFLQAGLAFFFVAAIAALKGEQFPPEIGAAVERVRVCWVDKYHLEKE